jgi:CRP/FNR family transcriptional regulator, cyclic AMP receptor protein
MRKVLYIFGQLSDQDIQWLIDTGHKASCTRGTVLIRMGEPIESLYILLEGALAVSVGPDGGQRIALLGSGDIVGEMSFVDSSPPSATVKAEQDSLLLAIKRETLLRKIADDTGFASRFYHAIAIFLADRLRSTVHYYEYSARHQKQVAAQGDEDELDETIVDGLSLAGERFKRILDQMMKAR